MSCDVGTATEGLENELWRRWSNVTSPMSELILQAFSHFTYVTAHSHSPKLSVTVPTSQLILQSFPRFTYVTTHSPTLPLLHLCHSSFSNPSLASLTSQDFRLRHLASRPCVSVTITKFNETKKCMKDKHDSWKLENAIDLQKFYQWLLPTIRKL